ncbi:MAG: 4-hydroxythreonine-4-phosphate dehydrogenase PdxA [Magnetococcales bacterium]|nr:4-hydroxythreonine-4-phosphate dehydrogenase PdxA [Magnetococcales bacterium]
MCASGPAPGGALPLAVTQGDPAGIGPEVALKAFLVDPEPLRLHIGDPDLYRWTGERLGLPVRVAEVCSPEEVSGEGGVRFWVLPTRSRLDLERLRFGRADAANAGVTLESIRQATELALQGRVAALVTPPINKSVFHAAGIRVPGHTELLGELTGSPHPVMMLTGGGLRVVPATIHIALAAVPGSLSREHLQRVVETTWLALRRDFGVDRPRVALAGLNPHAGEGGAFGDEESRIIVPVRETMAGRYGEGSVFGPLPADTLFHARAREGYDAVVCMYHDQALIPLKMLAFGEAVNVTLGLPVVRTSVDHGTAYDLAGRGVADPASLVAALDLARRMAGRRLVAGVLPT